MIKLKENKDVNMLKVERKKIKGIVCYNKFFLVVYNKFLKSLLFDLN